MSDYPKLMYRYRAGAERHDHVNCDTLQVCNADEEKGAKLEGYHETPAEAGAASEKPAPAPKPKPAAESKPDKAEDERPALRAEYERVYPGKKAFGGWSADQLREKIAAAGK